MLPNLADPYWVLRDAQLSLHLHHQRPQDGSTMIRRKLHQRLKAEA